VSEISTIVNTYLMDQSISHSLKGWTNQELGSKWLEQDFEPVMAAKCGDNEYWLLTIDGHNSHTTYQFCSFVERHKIIILCLPSHTTHCLQPCDISVFGSLNSTWKAEVTKLSMEMIPIWKNNLIKHYLQARKKAFTLDTIRNAWWKTGSELFNPDAISKNALQVPKN